MNISTDTTRCVSAGNCVLTAPEIFDQDDAGVVTLLDSDPPAEQHKAAREAMLHCPAQAITITDSHQSRNNRRRAL